MKKALLAIAVTLATISTCAVAAPTGSAYDRIQDARTGRLEADVEGAKLGVVYNDQRVTDHEQRITQTEQDVDHLNNVLGGTVQHINNLLVDNEQNKQDIDGLKTDVSVAGGKADAALSQSGDALNLAGEAKQDAQAALNGLDGKVDTNVYNQAQIKQATKDVQQDAAISNVKDDFKKDQARQDANLSIEAGNRVTEDDKLNQRVSDEQAARQQADGVLNGKIVDEGKARATSDAGLQKQISERVTSATYERERNIRDQHLAGLDARAQDLDTRIYEQKLAQQKTNQTVANHTAQLANHEQRIGALEQQTNSRFGNLQKQIDDNRQRASAAISGVAAMANIPQVTDRQYFSVGAGVGTTDGESAVAVGFSGRASENIVVKAAVSTDTQQNFVVGAGMSYGW